MSGPKMVFFLSLEFVSLCLDPWILVSATFFLIHFSQQMTQKLTLCLVLRILTKRNKLNQNQKNRKGRWERWVFACVVFLLVFLLYFFSLQKFLDLYQNRKNQSCEKNLGQVHSGLFFLVYLVFLEVFAVPSPTVQKLEATELFM